MRAAYHRLARLHGAAYLQVHLTSTLVSFASATDVYFEQHSSARWYGMFKWTRAALAGAGSAAER